MTEVLTPNQYWAGRRTPAKYRNQRCTLGGFKFDSKAEARRYRELLLLEQAGQIMSLHVHPRFALGTCGHALGHYEADFSYVDVKSEGSLVVEDVKSKPTRTALYRWKIRHLKAQYGIDVVEIGL